MTRNKQNAELSDSVMPGFDAKVFAKANEAAVSAMSHIGADTMHRVLQINTQYLEFIRNRLGQDMKMTDRLRECSTVPEAVEILSDFYKTAFEEYSKELAEMGEMATMAAAETVAEVEDETNKVLETAP